MASRSPGSSRAAVVKWAKVAATLWIITITCRVSASRWSGTAKPLSILSV